MSNTNFSFEPKTVHRSVYFKAPREIYITIKKIYYFISKNSYQIFCSTVAACRNLSLEKITDWADGKIFTADQALELKLIDVLGSISDAKEALKNLIEKKDNHQNHPKWPV